MEPSFDAGTMLLVGAVLVVGTAGAWAFQRLRFPQVVGYMVIGLIIGESGLRLVTTEDLIALEPVNLFALAIIGFIVGGELHASEFRQYGRQFAAIVLGEGVAALLCVSLPMSLLLYLVSGNLTASIAGALVLGAIASATDPASTVDVLWENRSLGILTTTIIAIVALDDALALLLYAIGTSLAQLVAGTEFSLAHEVWALTIELFGALALGIVVGLAFYLALRALNQPGRSLPLAVGAVLAIVGVSALLEMDVILATMAFGVTLTNIAPRRSKELFSIVQSFAAPIYVLFFVFVGARLNLLDMPLWLWGIAAVYVPGLVFGKIAGAWVGGLATGADPVVRNYTGLALLTQGGLAVGLAVMAGNQLDAVRITDDMLLSELVVFSVTATTFAVQLVGPVAVAWVVRRADEAGRNVTEEDVIAGLRVRDVMRTDIQVVREEEPLDRVIDALTTGDSAVLPVVNHANKLTGYLSFDALKEVLGEQETWPWLVARDVVRPATERLQADEPLSQALRRMRETGYEILFVTEADGSSYVGLVDRYNARRHIRQTLITRQQKAAAGQ